MQTYLVNLATEPGIPWSGLPRVWEEVNTRAPEAEDAAREEEAVGDARGGEDGGGEGDVDG